MKKVIRLTESDLVKIVKRVINEGTKKKGVIKYDNGNKYTGEYVIVDGGKIKSGKGTMIYKNGNKYEGSFKDNLLNGKGIYTWSSGHRYEGDFKNNRFNGYGIEYYPSGEKQMEGNFKDDLLNGQGTYFFEDGSKYIGNFKNGNFNGYGIQYYPSGEKKIEGNYKNDKLNGQVTSFNEDGSIESQGKYVNGKKIESSETKDVTTDVTNGEYIVQKGDSLSKIGQKLGVQWKEIATLNNIKNVNLIRVGQKLKIPGKTQTNADVQTNTTTTQTDYVSAYGPDVESIMTQLFTKMPSFKTFGKYVDKLGMSKGIDMNGIGTNLTVDEIKQKYPTELIDMPIGGFKFYSATEGRPFTKETYNFATALGSIYVKYLNDVISTPEY